MPVMLKEICGPLFSGEKAHQCEECGKCFGRRDHLTVHYKSVHLGEKVWQKWVDAAFLFTTAGSIMGREQLTLFGYSV